jgi:uncharacterized membrane protein YphA (DoxX/SURF4 family)
MNKLKFIALWILQFLLAALFAIQGIVKLGGSPAWASRFSRWGYPDHFYLAVGLAELLGAIALLIPRLAKFGALLLIAIMTGATATHIIHGEPQVVTTLVLFVLLAIILYMRRPATATATKLS